MQMGDEHLRSQPVQVRVTRLSCPGGSVPAASSDPRCPARPGPRGISLELALAGLWSLGSRGGGGGMVLTQLLGASSFLAPAASLQGQWCRCQ